MSLGRNINGREGILTAGKKKNFREGMGAVHSAKRYYPRIWNAMSSPFPFEGER